MQSPVILWPFAGRQQTKLASRAVGLFCHLCIRNWPRSHQARFMQDMATLACESLPFPCQSGARFELGRRRWKSHSLSHFSNCVLLKGSWPGEERMLVLQSTSHLLFTRILTLHPGNPQPAPGWGTSGTGQPACYGAVPQVPRRTRQGMLSWWGRRTHFAHFKEGNLGPDISF